MNIVISWLVLVYFVVLFSERIQSLGRTGVTHWFESGYATFSTLLVIASMAASIVMLALWNRTFWRSLVDASVRPDYFRLSITVGVALISGMVYTENTFGPIQFLAYGALILAMVLKTILVAKGGAAPLPLWYSLAYACVFSMAVPVIHPSKLAFGTFFVIIETMFTLALICCFSLMLADVMEGRGTHLLWWIPMILAVIGDTAIIVMHWKDGPNVFLMIFEGLMIAMFLVGKIVLKV